jgi:hypothetical protein
LAVPRSGSCTFSPGETMSGRKYEPGSPEWWAHARAMEADERARGIKGWWYLSFARPKAEGGFLGGCFIEAYGPVTALSEATRLGINPRDCEVASSECAPQRAAIFERYRDKLMSKAELEAMEDKGAVN